MWRNCNGTRDLRTTGTVMITARLLSGWQPLKGRPFSRLPLWQYRRAYTAGAPGPPAGGGAGGGGVGRPKVTGKPVGVGVGGTPVRIATSSS